MGAGSSQITPEQAAAAAEQAMKDMNSEMRYIDRQVSQIRREETKAAREMQMYVKYNDPVCMKIIAKEIVRARHTCERLIEAKANLKCAQNGIKANMAVIRVSGVMSNTVPIMEAMNQLVSVPELRDTMRDMSKQMAKAGLMEEMVNETMDDALGVEDEEEIAGAEVDRILDELMIGQIAKNGVAPVAQKQHMWLLSILAKMSVDWDSASDGGQEQIQRERLAAAGFIESMCQWPSEVSSVFSPMMEGSFDSFYHSVRPLLENMSQSIGTIEAVGGNSNDLRSEVDSVLFFTHLACESMEISTRLFDPHVCESPLSLSHQERVAVMTEVTEDIMTKVNQGLLSNNFPRENFVALIHLMRYRSVFPLLLIDTSLDALSAYISAIMHHLDRASQPRTGGPPNMLNMMSVPIDVASALWHIEGLAYCFEGAGVPALASHTDLLPLLRQVGTSLSQ
ncbi:Snf7 family protein [Kipferlia bialata]|uniref:Snf7 family protein n=1 Tax=Kipferlia bialata TaxID=797122 RepID=A0A9K3CPC7_9EUKA|nr:Snf7 family protein [Kipferlia bialata]|eukprot:g1895.t1